MGLSCRDMVRLEARRRSALESGGAALDRPIEDAIDHVEGGNRLKRVVRSYNSIDQFLRTDLSTLLGIPGMATQTVATIQGAIDVFLGSVATGAADKAPTPAASTGYRLLADARQRLGGQDGTTCEVTLRNGIAVRSVTAIDIEDELAHLRCKPVMLRTDDRIHMVDADDVMMVSMAA